MVSATCQHDSYRISWDDRSCWHACGIVFITLPDVGRLWVGLFPQPSGDPGLMVWVMGLVQQRVLILSVS